MATLTMDTRTLGSDQLQPPLGHVSVVWAIGESTGPCHRIHVGLYRGEMCSPLRSGNEEVTIELIYGMGSAVRNPRIQPNMSLLRAQ